MARTVVYGDLNEDRAAGGLQSLQRSALPTTASALKTLFGGLIERMLIRVLADQHRP